MRKKWICIFLILVLSCLSACNTAKESKETPNLNFASPTPIVETRVPTDTPQKTATPTETPTATPTETPSLTPNAELLDKSRCYQFPMDGLVADWFTEGDLIHVAFENPNRYVIYDSNTGAIVKEVALSGKPAEMHWIKEELWISYPGLQCIKIYNKDTLKEKREISLKHEVGAFDVYGDILFYTQDNDFVSVYRYDVKTDTSQIVGDYDQFYSADVLVDADAKLLYICDSELTSSKAYCYDAETLELKSFYEQDNYGFPNLIRNAILFDGGLYWGEFRLNAADVSKMERNYPGNDYTGMLHADEKYVITTDGIYDNATGQQLAALELNETCSAATATVSGNIMIAEKDVLTIYLAQGKEPEQTEKPTAKPTNSIDEIMKHETSLRLQEREIVDWFTEGQYVHAIFKNQAYYMIFDSNTGKIVKETKLEMDPGEIHLINGELWISYPGLLSIKVYNKDTLKETRSIFLNRQVCSFDVYGDYLVYAEEDQWVPAFRYHLKTGAEKEIKVDENTFENFYFADVMIDGKTKTVYISDSHGSGSRVYCYDLETLKQKAVFSPDGFGYDNPVRRMFLLDGGVYWGEYRLIASDITKIERQYVGVKSAGMYQVDDNYVITNNGIYETATGKMLYTFDATRDIKAAMMTQSGNIVILDSKFIYFYKK